MVLDDVEGVSNVDLREIFWQLRQIKLVKGVFIATRRELTIGRSPVLSLTPIPNEVVESLISDSLRMRLSPEQLRQAAHIIRGNPLAADVLLGLINDKPEDIDRLLGGVIYDVTAESGLAVPGSAAGPRIITATEDLIKKLKSRPEDIYTISPRRFEELLAELLSDMGLDVVLTPQTRDKGRDLLAYVNSPVGRLLCLVEAKRHRKDRPVGIDLVTRLYGTLCTENANSAMLVTTSYFSAEARGFQRRFAWQLQLREYGDVIKWIGDYRSGSRSAFSA